MLLRKLSRKTLNPLSKRLMRSRIFGRAESNVSERARKMEGNVEFSDYPNNSMQQAEQRYERSERRRCVNDGVEPRCKSERYRLRRGEVITEPPVIQDKLTTRIIRYNKTQTKQPRMRLIYTNFLSLFPIDFPTTDLSVVFFANFAKGEA